MNESGKFDVQARPSVWEARDEYIAEHGPFEEEFILPARSSELPRLFLDD